MGVLKDVATGIGDLLTGGALSARKERKRASKEARQARESAIEETQAERRRRRSTQRAALQSQPSLFDMLGGPDA